MRFKTKLLIKFKIYYNQFKFYIVILHYHYYLYQILLNLFNNLVIKLYLKNINFNLRYEIILN